MAIFNSKLLVYERVLTLRMNGFSAQLDDQLKEPWQLPLRGIHPPLRYCSMIGFTKCFTPHFSVRLMNHLVVPRCLQELFADPKVLPQRAGSRRCRPSRPGMNIADIARKAQVVLAMVEYSPMFFSWPILSGGDMVYCTLYNFHWLSSVDFFQHKAFPGPEDQMKSSHWGVLRDDDPEVDDYQMSGYKSQEW